MSGVKSPQEGVAEEIQILRDENATLLGELENAYAQLAAVIQVSQDETRIAYGELQEKLLVAEKEAFDLEQLSQIGIHLGLEADLVRLRHLIVDKMSVMLPVDLSVLHLQNVPGTVTSRERDVVFDSSLDPEGVAARQRLLELGGRRNGHPLVVTELDSGRKNELLRLRSDAHSAALVPLVGRDFVGVLVLNSRLPGNFRSDQENMLINFGAHAGTAVHNVLMQRSVQILLAAILRDQGLSPDVLNRLYSEPNAELETVREALGKFLEDTSAVSRKTE